MTVLDQDIMKTLILVAIPFVSAIAIMALTIHLIRAFFAEAIRGFFTPDPMDRVDEFHCDCLGDFE